MESVASTDTRALEVRSGLAGANGRLSLLGTFALHTGSGEMITIGSKKNRALLAILALSTNGSAPRDRIAALLWGNHGEEQARGSLRQSLAVLRKELGPGGAQLICSHDEAVSLDVEGLAIDAREVLAAAGGDHLGRLRQAAALWRGEFLADVALRDSSFDEWLRLERTRLKAAAIRLFEGLTERESGAARIEAAEKLLTLDPLRETSHRLLMRAHAEHGDLGLALKQYERCRELLREELQVEPAAETQALRREIAQGSGPGTAPRSPEPPPQPPIRLELPDRPSIAVLPFDNANSDPEQLFFSDGITEELIANLSHFRRLFVIARNSSFAYRGKALGPRDIGRQLGVGFLLHGSVRRSGQRIRVTAELIDAEREASLWAEKFDRADDDVFDVVDELASAIVSTTVGRLEDEVLRKARRKPTGSLAAYEHVLRGRALMHSSRWEDKLAARRAFEEAIGLDENFAMAHTQLALTHLYEFFWDDSGQALDRAAEIASHALSIDEEEAWCHMVLGLTHLHRRRFDLALAHCERSVHLNPNDPGLSAKLGLVLADLGRPDEAIAIIEKAMRLAPLHPEAYSDYLALALFGARRYEDAIKALQSVPETSYYCHSWFAACYAQLGNRDRAAFHAARVAELAPEFSVSRVAAREPLRDPADLAHWTEALAAAGIRP